MEPVFSRLEGFPELPFQDGEDGFNLVSLMVLIRIKQFRHSSSIIPGDSFTFSGSDRDKGTRVQGIPDWQYEARVGENRLFAWGSL